MAEQNSEADRSEPATPFKLEEARRSGSVPKSTEVNGATALLLALLAAGMFSDWALLRVARLDRSLFLSSGEWIFDIPHLMAQFHYFGEATVFILSPLLVLVVIGAVLSNLLQSGPVFSFKPLVPDFSKINPATGLKRLFSMRSIFEAFKAVLKLTFVVTVAYFSIKALLPVLPSLYERAPKSFPSVFRHFSLRLFSDLLMAIVAIALADLLYTRYEFAKRMRMSRRDMKEELKRREGDPQVRGRRRELRREILKRTGSITQVKDSDALITNPQHYAVAIKYRRGEKPAPEVLAKGAGEMAQQMRELAFRHGIPIIPSPKLARELFVTVPIGAMIQEKHYELVATILKRVYERRQRTARETPQ